MFVILGLRTKSFRIFIKRFSTIFKTAVYVSTDMFCGKIFFLQYRIVSKIFLPLFHKSARRFSKLHLACSGEKFELISFVLENKNFFVFLWFFFLEIYLKTSWNRILSVQKLIFRVKRLLKTPQKSLFFLRLEANHFRTVGKPFSIKLSKLLFMCPNKRFVAKSLIISFKIWEKYSGISGRKQDLHSVLSKTALTVWRESLTVLLSDFFQFLSRVSKQDTSSAEKMFE